MSDADDVAEKVAFYEKFFDGAWAEKYAESSTLIAESSTARRMRIDDFVRAYAEGGYPVERLAKCVDRVIDLKLQLYYLTEIEVNAYNVAYFWPLMRQGLTEETASPHLLLVRLAQDQNVIGKIRVFWERLMNLVYFVENGREIPKSNSGSKKKKFFEWVRSEEGEQWHWLAPFEAVIDDYDRRFRTAEFHKSSVLRAEIERRKVGSLEIMSRGVNYFIGGGLWANIILVISGQEPTHPVAIPRIEL